MPFTPPSRKGYLLQEIIVAVAIFGVLAPVIIKALTWIPRLRVTLGEQSRRAAWRTAADEVIGLGIDPSQTGLLSPLADPGEKAIAAPTVSRTLLTPRAGSVHIFSLSGTFAQTPEERAMGAGWEIGGDDGPGLPPRVDPRPPLPPIKLRVPSITPANGTFVPVVSLPLPANPDSLANLALEARGASPADRVRFNLSAPRAASAEGLGSAELVVTVMELLAEVRGGAWAEYAGNPASDIALELGDGRKRWLVQQGERVQVYEPSDVLEVGFGLDLGRPVFLLNGLEHLSGETIAIDLPTALAVETGTQSATIGFSAAVRSRFGDAWEAVSPAFRWTAGSFEGDSSVGNTRSFFSRDVRRTWQATQLLSAIPLPPGGGRALIGTWTIERKALVLAPPERASAFYDAATDQLGTVEFRAPVPFGMSSPVGRPTVDGIESVGTTLTVPLVP